MDILRIPFAINIRDLPAETVNALLDEVEQVLDGQYFRDRQLFLDVLADQVQAAQQPRNFLYGPYLKVVAKDGGVLRITSGDVVHGGETVYAYDQICHLLRERQTHAQEPMAPRPSQRQR